MDAIKRAVLNSGTLQRDMNIILGLSGGPDSLTLLNVLFELREDFSLTILPVHVNHKLRENADREQEHIEDICRDMGLECITYQVDCKSFADEMKLSVEEAGRIARYGVFSEVADSLSSEITEKGGDPASVAIAVGHNADDLSETVIFRIIRGTGIHGLAGIMPQRSDSAGRPVIRPLLTVTRDEIEKYVADKKLSPNRDETNEETDAARNRIRLELLPYIEENINSGVKENLRRLANSAAIDDDYLERVGEAVYAEATEIDTAEESVVLHTAAISDMHPAIIRRVIVNALRDFGLERNMTMSLVDEVSAVAFSDRPSARLNLPGGILCERRYGDLIFKSESQVSDERTDELRDMRLVPQVLGRKEFESEVGGAARDKMIYAAFDFDLFKEVYPGMLGKLTVRTREAGDYMALSGGSRKKLQDYFVDSKIPKALRGGVPIVAVGSEVLWIPPNKYLPTAEQRSRGKYSQNYQISDTTKEVLFLEIVGSI